MGKKEKKELFLFFPFFRLTSSCLPPLARGGEGAFTDPPRKMQPRLHFPPVASFLAVESLPFCLQLLPELIFHNSSSFSSFRPPKVCGRRRRPLLYCSSIKQPRSRGKTCEYFKSAAAAAAFPPSSLFVSLPASLPPSPAVGRSVVISRREEGKKCPSFFRPFFLFPSWWLVGRSSLRTVAQATFLPSPFSARKSF